MNKKSWMRLGFAVLCVTGCDELSINATCGNGIVEPGEQCDEGNTEPREGCSATCEIKPGYTCTGKLGEKSECTRTCGNGVVEEGEDCDPGTGTLEGCTAECKAADGYWCDRETNECFQKRCNDGRLDKKYTFPSVFGRGELTEQCDDGNAKAGDGCDPECQIEQFTRCQNTFDNDSSCVNQCENDMVVEINNIKINTDNMHDTSYTLSSATENSTENKKGVRMALTWGNENENDSKPAILVKAVQRDFRRMSERYPKININAVDIDKMAEKMNSLEGCAEYQETDCSQDVCGNKVNELICVDSNNEYHYRFDGTPRHPDFSACYNISNVQGMVKNMLGTDHKPVYQKASKGALCKASFDMWFNDDAYYNKSETQYLVFVKDDKGYKYSTLEGKQVEEQTDYMYSHILMDYHKNSNDNPDGTLRKLSRWDYHPLDYRGFHKEIDFSPQGTECSWGDKCENDAFTSEITGYIQLTKDEKRVYEAHSDDDSWVFINDRLVIDNGGRHGVVKSYYDLNENVVEVTLDDMYNKSVPVKYYKDIDAFEGGIYPIKVFYADRNGGSDLHLVIPDLIDPSIVKCQTGTDSDAVEQ